VSDEKNRRRKAEGIHTIEHAAGIIDPVTPVLDPVIALDCLSSPFAEKPSATAGIETVQCDLD